MAHEPSSAPTRRLIAPPPRISHANSAAASARNGLTPAARMAETCVVTPSAAMAIASMTVSKAMAAPSTMPFGRTAYRVERRDSRQSRARTTEPQSVRRRGLPRARVDGTCLPKPGHGYSRGSAGCATGKVDSAARNGASIITRTILAMTAVLAAPSLIARPAATTCATSWTVEPAKMPVGGGRHGEQADIAR